MDTTRTRSRACTHTHTNTITGACVYWHDIDFSRKLRSAQLRIGIISDHVIAVSAGQLSCVRNERSATGHFSPSFSSFSLYYLTIYIVSNTPLYLCCSKYPNWQCYVDYKLYNACVTATGTRRSIVRKRRPKGPRRQIPFKLTKRLLSIRDCAICLNIWRYILRVNRCRSL